MKKATSFLVFLLVSGMLLFGGGNKEESGKIKIGVAIQGLGSQFMTYVVAGMYEEVKDNPNVELLVVYADSRADKQVSQVETFVAQEVDAIILNPVDKVASSPCVDAANKAGIPIITVNTQTENQDSVLAFSGSDDIEAGRLQMEYLAKQVGYKGNAVIIHGSMGHDAQINRRIGYLEIINKYPDLNLLYEQSADWLTDKAQLIMENWLQMGEPIAIVATNCDTMAIGAQNAIDAVGKTGKILVGGMDAIPDVMNSIEIGGISCTLWQDGIGQGREAVKIALAALNGESVEDVYIPFEVVQKGNLEEFKKRAIERDALQAKYF